MDQFERIFGTPYTYLDVKHNNPKEFGLTWKQMEASGDVSLAQNRRLFERVVTLDEVKSVLTESEKLALDRSMKYMESVNAGEIVFFLFRSGGGPRKLFMAFIGQRENDEYNQFSRRKNPVVQENFETFLSNPDKVWADVIQDVIRSGGFYVDAQLPSHLPPDTVKKNAENREKATNDGDDVSLTDRIGTL